MPPPIWSPSCSSCTTARASRCSACRSGPTTAATSASAWSAAFDRFIDVRTKSDHEVAALLATLKVDIAVDLKGHTRDSRPGILAPPGADPGELSRLSRHGRGRLHRLRHRRPGRRAARARAVLRREDRAAARLLSGQRPQAHDRGACADAARRRACRRRASCSAASTTTTRSRPPLFDVWMRLLQAVPGSVLWLLRDNAGAEANLRREARRAASIRRGWCSPAA